MSGKTCDKCGLPFKGFGSTCSACRKGGKAAAPKSCDTCGNFFTGFGTVCQECVNGKGPGRTGVRAPTAEEIDQTLDKIDSCVSKLDASQQSAVRLRKAEFDLLGQLEIARDLLSRIVKSQNKSLLRSCFGDSSRVARLGAFLDAIRLSDMNAADQRMRNCRQMHDSLCDLLQSDLGCEVDVVAEAQETAQTGLLMKRLSFLMDEEKVVETHKVIDTEESGPKSITENYASAYDVGGPAAGYGASGGSYDELDGQFEEDYSDWEDEDIEEMSEEQAETLFKNNARILFDELDTNKDGALSKQEVLNGAVGLYGLLKACRIHKRKQVIKMFKEGDMDRNGTLDFDEFVTYIHSSKQRSSENAPKPIDDTKAKKVFDLMDRDGDGTITREELKLAYAGVLLMAGEVVDSKRISKWSSRNFKKYDTDGSGTLDLKEFKVLLQRSGALAPMLDFADNM